MNSSEKKKLIVLLALLPLLGWSLFSAVTNDPQLSRRGIAGQRAGTRVQDEVPNLRVLREDKPQAVQIRRNVFQFEGENTPPQTTQPERLSSIPVTPPPPPPPDVRYLGYYLEKSGKKRKLAAISNSGRIYVGREGQLLAGKYRVVRIEDEFLILQFLPENKRMRLPLGKTGSPVLEPDTPLADVP